jgi:transposase-like protein
MTIKRRQFSASEKEKLVFKLAEVIELEGQQVSGACMRAGITPKQYYQWKELLRKGGSAALQPKSKRPKTFGNQISESIRQQVISEAQSGRHDSANQIKIYLESCDVKVSSPTVIKILEDANLYGFVNVRDKDGKLVTKRRGFLLPANG